MKPRLLDLFCGAGGAAMGYHRAGFEVVGVDVKPQPRYPFTFIRQNALDVLDTGVWRGFDVVHASPPCQAFSITGNLARAQGRRQSEIDLLTPTRERLIAIGLPYVIENVPGAPLRNHVVVCGQSKEIGLGVRRHRWFEASIPLIGTTCDHKAYPRPIGVYHAMNDEVPSGGKTARTLEEGRAAMGVDWMTWKELTQAIPPAYTEWIGKQLMDASLAPSGRSDHQPVPIRAANANPRNVEAP